MEATRQCRQVDFRQVYPNAKLSFLQTKTDVVCSLVYTETRGCSKTALLEMILQHSFLSLSHESFGIMCIGVYSQSVQAFPDESD